MKGEKGICTTGIRRTKFDTEKNALDAMRIHIGLGFIAPDYVVYQCKECHHWHFGKPDWKDMYGK